MKNFKNLTAVAAAFIFAFAFAIAKPQKVQAAEDDSGKCGENATYTFVGSTGTLTISGTGQMYDYNNMSLAPWNKYRSDINTVVIDGNITNIGNYVFDGCTSLTSVEIPNSVTSIGNYAFEKCTSLTSITIPKSVTSIGKYAFVGCTSLTEINVDTGNTKFSSDNGVLYNKDKTELIMCPIGKTSVTIPNTVTSIGSEAFRNCTGLTSIEIPASVTGIGKYAFVGCTSLTSIEIPNSVTGMDESVFEDCTSLTEINVDTGNTNYSSSDDGVLYNKEKTELIMCPIGKTSVTIPNTVTTIGDYAFENCTNLTSIEIPNSVTSIKYDAFDGCTGLTSITIPASVTSIWNYAFVGCTGLTSIEIPNSVTSIGKDAFKGCESLNSITFDGTEDEWNNAKGSNDIGITVTPTFRDYTPVTGQELKYTKGSGKGLVIRFIRTTNPGTTFDYFDKDATDAVQIDETPLEASNYKAESGSLKLTLNAAYLEGLSEDDHSLQVNFKDGGTAYADFTIVGAGGGNGGESNKPNNQGGGDVAQTGTTTGTTETTADNPKTGDSNAMAILWFSITAISAAALIIVERNRKRA